MSNKLLKYSKELISRADRRNAKWYRILVFHFILILFSNYGFSQMTPLYSHYTMNTYLINPAMAGNEGYTAFTLTAREQWLGMKESPMTHALSAETRLLRNSYIFKSVGIRKRSRHRKRSGRVGLATYLMNDINGLINRTGLNMTYGYHISFRYSQLSFGASGMIYQYKIDKDQFISYSGDDEYLDAINRAYFIPDANFGVVYRNQYFLAGLSVNQLFETNVYYLYADNQHEYEQMKRHYFMLMQYQYELPAVTKMMLEPSVLFKTNDYFNSQIDFNFKVYLENQYWSGLSIRTGGYGAFVIMAGLKLRQFNFGYAYDYSFSSIKNYSYGSHEIVAGLKFGDNARRYRWLNRY